MQKMAVTPLKRRISLLLVLVLLLSAFPLAVSAEEISATTTTGVNLREGKSTNTKALMVIPTGTSVTVTDTSDPDWYGVSLTMGSVRYSGYVYSEYLNLSSTPSTSTPSTSGGLISGAYATTLTSSKLYEREDLSSSTVGAIGRGVVLSVFSLNNTGFVGVELSDGTRGYVLVNDVYVVNPNGTTTTSAPTATATPAPSGTSEVATAKTTVTVNVRSGQGTGTSVVDVLPAGITVSVTDMSNPEWFGVRFTSNGTTTKTGYIYSIYLDIVSYTTPSQTAAPSVTPAPTAPVGATPRPGESVVAEVTAKDGLILRKGPGTTYGALGQLGYGTKVSILEKTSETWYKVKASDGSEGYVYAEYVRITSGSLVPGTPVPTASPAPGTGVYGMTLADLSLRQGPGFTYSILDIVRKATTVRIYEVAASKSEGDWYRVSLEDGRNGYLSAAYVTVLSGNIDDLDPSAAVPTATPVPGSTATKKFVQVTADELRFRESPSLGGKILDVVKSGTILEVIDRNNLDWVHVRTSDGKEGYVSDDYVVDYDPYSSTATQTITLPKYQTFYTQGDGAWSSDSNIVSVTSGASGQVFLYAANVGTARVTVGDSVLAVNVTEPEAVRYAYSSPNVVPVDTVFDLVAVTDAEKTGVRFEVVGSMAEYDTSTYTSETTGINQTRVFTAKAKVSTPGLYTLRAYSTSGQGYSQSYKEFTVLVVSTAGVTQTSSDERRMSDEMLEILASFEGYVSTVEPDRIVGVPTVGYGKVVSLNTSFYNNLTPIEARAMLAETVNAGSYTSEVNRFVQSNGLLISQCQFDALVSFTYNVGTSWLNSSTVRDVILNAVRLPEGLGNTVLNASATNDMWIYSDHSASNRPVGSFKAGDLLYVNGAWGGSSNGIWYHVSNGATEGWVRSGYVRLTNLFGMQRDLNYVDAYTFGSELVKWNQAGGQCYVGLYYRRLAEAKVFSYANYDEARKTSPNYQKNTYGYEVPDCLT